VFAEHSTLQRTWTEDEVTSFFLTDGDYCMVAETKDGEIAGFVLGTVMERPRWHYGYLVWMGVLCVWCEHVEFTARGYAWVCGVGCKAAGWVCAAGG
jgi:hypothetical protein